MNASPVEAVLLAGLTDGGDESPAMSVLSDAHRELTALDDLLGLDLDGEPLDRDPMIVLLDDIERRLSAGISMLRLARTAEAPAQAPAPVDDEITHNSGPESGS